MNTSWWNGWHFMRWFRLGFGILLGVQAVSLQDSFAGIVAVFFLFQAFTNTGCCGSEGCALPAARTDDRVMENRSGNEVK